MGNSNMVLDMGFKKHVVMFLAPDIKEASGEYYSFVDFIENEYKTKGFCELANFNPDLLKFLKDNRIEIGMRMAKIENGKLFVTQDHDEKELTFDRNYSELS